MELLNRSRLPAQVITAIDKDGREHLVVIARATWRFHPDGRAPELAEEHEQRPVALSDAFVGEPGLSAPRYEADLAPRKRRCDVLLDASAHAPDERPVTELDVGVRVGAMEKKFLVLGDRTWKRGALSVSATKPQPFTAIPLHYGRAFGGSRPKKPGRDGRIEEDTYFRNPVGVGYSSDTGAGAIDGMPLPSTEDFHERVTAPNGAYAPLALGPLGRHWDPRRRHAGTYDDAWRQDVAPFLPDDFDEAFHQSAPPDQQIDFPRGGELVALRHLVPGRPLVTFELPSSSLLVKILHASHRVTELEAVVDTVFIEPDAGLFTLVHRASLPLDRRGLFGIKLVAAGKVCERWWSSKVLGTEDCGCDGFDDQDAAPDGDAAPPAPPAPDTDAAPPDAAPAPEGA